MTNDPVPRSGFDDHDDDRDSGHDRPSRAAEYIAALYVALLLCTPWLLRETPWLTPPSKGVEIQMSNTAQMRAVADHDAVLARRPALANAPANGNLPVHGNPAR